MGKPLALIKSKFDKDGTVSNVNRCQNLFWKNTKEFYQKLFAFNDIS